MEALHKKFKNEFLQGKRFASHDTLAKALPKLIDAYHNQCHDSLFGLTPLEVWNGLLPDKNQYRTSFYKPAIKENWPTAGLIVVPIYVRFSVLST